MLIINADDWGRSVAETDAVISCLRAGSVTSISAMMFMRDSERAAQLAKSLGVDVGLHLNFSELLSGPDVPLAIREPQQRTVRFLQRSKYALIVYHPFLRDAFRRVYQDQAAEFARLYGRQPSHVNGHQHMHLCTNILIDEVIPAGQRVRRSFSFTQGEKSWVNLAYRRWVDRRLAKRYRLTDYFFPIDEVLKPDRLVEITLLARNANVELMTHPFYESDQSFLLSDRFLNAIHSLTTGSYAQL